MSMGYKNDQFNIWSEAGCSDECPSALCGKKTALQFFLSVLQGPTAAEYKAAHAACLLLGRRAAGLEEQIASASCVLVMEYVPGPAFLATSEPFQPALLPTTAADLGRRGARAMLSCALESQSAERPKAFSHT